ncbi:MAG: septal ring lytic transglycosylase RlpA family protein [Firmicutes bacterium]|nr:septal ring lytic transglycosylase RlpA family protein [Bacillota bacterium]
MAFPDRLIINAKWGKVILLFALLLIAGIIMFAATAEKTVVLQIDGKQTTLATRAKTVADVLAENRLYARSCDLLQPAAETTVFDGLEIFLQRAQPVLLKADGTAKLIYSTARTVAELVQAEQIKLSQTDRVVPELSSALTKGSTVQIVRVTAAQITEEVEIPFQTIHKKDPNLTAGRKVVQVEGKPGLVKKTYQVVYADGVEESRELINEEELIKPVNCVVAIGTKPVPVIASRGGTAGRVYEGMASYYSDKFHGCRTSYGAVYDKNAYTAAFPDKALRGKKLRVTYLKTGRSVEVTVNDFGPHVKGRIIDLSAAAARAIGLTSAGVGKVKVEVLN